MALDNAQLLVRSIAPSERGNIAGSGSMASKGQRTMAFWQHAARTLKHDITVRTRHKSIMS